MTTPRLVQTTADLQPSGWQAYAKSLVGALVAALTAAGAALVGDGQITVGEWLVVAVAFLVALGGVWVVPNRVVPVVVVDPPTSDPPGQHEAPAVPS